MNGTSEIEVLQASEGYIGPSLKDYYAAHAPTEIPAWFEGNNPDFEGEGSPLSSKEYEALSAEEKSLISAWLEDGVWDLPTHLEWFESQFKAHQQDKQEYLKDCKIGRYFQWRKYYAEQMMEVMES